MLESVNGLVLTPGVRWGAGRTVPWGLEKGSLVGRCRNRALSWKLFHRLLVTNNSGTTLDFCLDRLLLRVLLSLVSSCSYTFKTEMYSGTLV